MSDPYRSVPVLRCVRCDTELSPIGDWLACRNGCGHWMDRERLPSSIDQLGVSEAFAGVTGNCPRCFEDLDARTWSTLRFEACREHGIWLDRGGHYMFDELLASAQRSADRVSELADALATQSPAAFRQLAARIVALEDQVAALRKT